MAKFCGACGAQMDDSARVCGMCGTPFAGPVNRGTAYPQYQSPFQTQSQTPTKKKPPVAAIAVICVVILGVIIGLAVSGSKGGYTDYKKTLSVACKAVNKKSKSAMKSVVLSKLGDDWNEEAVYSIFDDDEYDSIEKYLPLDPDDLKVGSLAFDYLKETIEDELESEDIDVDIQDIKIAQPEDSYSFIILLIKVDGRWYVGGLGDVL